MSDPQDLIKQATDICEPATPGPWRSEFRMDGMWSGVMVDGEHLLQMGYGSVEDAEFIATARTLVPELAAALEKAIQPNTLTAEPPDVWLIQSTDGRVDTWWRKEGSGYTTELIAAGTYTEAAARKSAANRPQQDKAVSLRDAIRGLDCEGTVAGLLGWVSRPGPVEATFPSDWAVLADVRVWEEDDACLQDPDNERLPQAWRRIFGEDLEQLTALATCDGGDAIATLYSRGRVAWQSCMGGAITRIPLEKQGGDPRV
jgi:hypothetical protein